MAVLHDYFCDTHGLFESWDAKCPMKLCKGEISKVFLKPVGMKSDKTKHTDKTLNQLAIDYDMTDIKSTREGEHQTGYLKRNNELSDKQFAEATDAMNAQNQQAQREARPGDSVIWGGGGNINMKSVMGGQFKSVMGESVGINPKAAGNLSGPKAASYVADHENLQVSKP
jgi:hypothetical protein